jgi:HlyD family secretion protein
VAESDIGRLKPGMRVSFTVDAYPGEPFRGSIRDIRNAPQVVQNVVTYDAVIDVANDDLKLKPGMTATVSVVTDRRRDVLAIPNAALRFRPETAGAGQGQRGSQAASSGAGGNRQRGQGGGGDGSWRRDREDDNEEGGVPEVVKRTVYVLQGDKAVPREVITGITDGRVTEIVEGVKEGDNVIVSVAGQNPNQQQRGQGQRGFRIL